MMTTRTLALLLAISVMSWSACSKKDKDNSKSKPAKIEKRRSGERGSPERRAQRLQKRLELSEEQRVAVEAALRDNPEPVRAQEAVKAILTPAQKAKYEALLSGRDRNSAHDPAARAAQMQTALGLDADQTSKLEAIYKARKSRSEQRDQVKAILTPEQFAKHEEIGARRDPRRFRRRGFAAPVERAAWLQRELGLDDEQREKIATALKTPHTQPQRIAAMKGILTAAQFVEYEDMRANRSELRPKHGFKAPAERAAWLHKELGLDDGQRARLEEVFKAAKSREAVLEALGQILSKEQLASHEELFAKRPRREVRPLGAPRRAKP